MRNLLFLACVIAPSLSAQVVTPPVVTTIGEITVTAERITTPLKSSTGSVTRLTAEELSRVPHATLADLLKLAPGFTQVNADGSGGDPRVMVRGFYGGGEAEYIVVLVDGKPVNQLNTGLVAWDALPALASISSIEIMRGSASAQYGDAALGGTINIITQSGARTAQPAFSLSMGTFGTRRASIVARPEFRDKSFGFSMGYDKFKGFRDHSERGAVRGTFNAPLLETARNNLALSLRGQWRDYDEPGPLLASLLASRPERSDELFQFDHTQDASYQVSLDGGRDFVSGGTLQGSINTDIRDIDATRTVALAPGFGDTKARDLTMRRLGASVQYQFAPSSLPLNSDVLLGMEWNRGALNSKYFLVASGDLDAYVSASGTRGDLDASGDGTRAAGALFAQLSAVPASALRLSAGVRYDWLRDSFHATKPEDDKASANHSSVSPKVGMNLRYLSGSDVEGHAYITASRSFKAPTLDQLFDQRSIPVPFPPFSIHTSNNELRPQHGTSYEGGVYQDLRLTSGIAVALSLSAYTIAMTDELDFDVAALKYVNIGKSQHRGLETGLTISNNLVSVFLNATTQSARTRGGENDGHFLKAIPRQSFNGGVSLTPNDKSLLSVTVTSVRDIWLDDANTVALDPWTTADLRLSYTVSQYALFVDVTNVFDKKYSSGGYLDPAGTGEVYFNPAAGRRLEVGMRSAW